MTSITVLYPPPTVHRTYGPTCVHTQSNDDDDVDDDKQAWSIPAFGIQRKQADL